MTSEMRCTIFIAGEVEGLREGRDVFGTEPGACVMLELRSAWPSILPSSKDGDQPLSSPWEFHSARVPLPTFPHTCPVPGQGADGSGRALPGGETQCPQYQAERSALKGHRVIQTGHGRVVEEEASKQDLRWGAVISWGANGRLGGGWNILGGRNHSGKAGGQGAGERG